MTEPGKFTEQEILSQPQAWTETIRVLKAQQNEIEHFLKKKDYNQILFTGCGSPYYLSLAAAAFCQQLTGRIARGIPASELWLNPENYYWHDGKTLLVAVSRSGETTETLNACESFKAAGRGTVLTLSCYPDYPLTKMGDINLVFPSGQERSIAQTRAFTTLYLATIGLVCFLGNRGDIWQKMEILPALCENILQVARPWAERFSKVSQLDRFYFLGSGLRYGLACELSLKMKEMSLSQSEPFHFMEFRHGPKSMVTGTTLLIGLISRANGSYEKRVISEMSALGAGTFTLAPEGGDIAFTTDLPEALVNALYLPPGQLLAFERSIARGLNPDEPYLLDAVVKL
jgi:glucosamine--fructose-6-phosphate aminotransferase (isomerizing)